MVTQDQYNNILVNLYDEMSNCPVYSKQWDKEARFMSFDIYVRQTLVHLISPIISFHREQFKIDSKHKVDDLSPRPMEHVKKAVRMDHMRPNKHNRYFFFCAGMTDESGVLMKIL